MAGKREELMDVVQFALDAFVDINGAVVSQSAFTYGAARAIVEALDTQQALVDAYLEELATAEVETNYHKNKITELEEKAHALDEPCNCTNGIGCVYIPFELW